jgi:two-component system OmpR family sensor kinase/two-component system sensor histidine kinase BaeS
VKHSLRSRLILSFLGVIVLAAGSVAVLANRITTDRFTYLVSHTGQMQAYRLAPLFAEYYQQSGSWSGVEALLDLEAAFPGNSMGRGRHGAGMPMMSMMSSAQDGYDRWILAGPDGRVVIDSEGERADLPVTAEALRKGAPIVVGDHQVGTLLVASGLGTLTSDQSGFLGQVNQLLLGAAAVAVLAGVFVASLQARRIAAPVRALATAARRVADGDLTQRVPATSQDELGEMADAFNAMAARLQEQYELRRRAMADVAHELRTPLSVLQLDLESIEDGLTAPTPQTLARLKEEVALLSRLVEDLRMLSLVEAGELQMERRPVDICELLRTTVARVRSAAQDKGVDLCAQIPDELSLVVGDRQRLAQVLLNLLSNALRHTPPGGQVTIAARHEGVDELQVTVQDTGEGISASELPHLFERYSQSDQRRHRATGGSGLGLAIARSLVEAHGGHIWADSVEGQGSTFSFALPLSRNA